MHRLYVDDCKQTGEFPVTSSFNRDVFVTEINCAFHQPQKYQCQLCNRYFYERDEGALSQEREEFEEHGRGKTEAGNEQTGGRLKQGMNRPREG